MFHKSDQNLIEQAQGIAQDIADALAPHVDNAKEQLGPRLADARDQLGPRLAEAREQLAPVLADAREKAKDKVVNEVVPAVQAAAASAKEQAGPIAEEAKRRGRNAALSLAGDEPAPKKSHKLRKLLVFLGLAGVAAFVAKKLTSSGSHQEWQSYPAPAPSGSAPSTPATAAPAHAAEPNLDAPVDDAADESSADAAGADPTEALADSTDEPHPVTTPDEPAEVVEVEDETGDEAEEKAAETGEQ